MDKKLPPLQFDDKPRAREFNTYSEEDRSAVVFNYLVNGMSFRELDANILKVSFDSHGWQSMGICHYLGLSNVHKGFFKGWMISDILNALYLDSENPDYCIIYYYIAEYSERYKSLTDRDRSQLLLLERDNPSEEVKEKSWIYNTLLKHEDTNERIDSTLLSLPSHAARVVIRNNIECYIRNTTIAESVKSLYNYRCQICGDVILRTGWQRNLERKTEWKFLSSDVHHILPLSKGGEDDRANMLCLCPTCHRKFHSGEYRLKSERDAIKLSDELIGASHAITLKHQLGI